MNFLLKIITIAIILNLGFAECQHRIIYRRFPQSQPQPQFFQPQFQPQAQTQPLPEPQPQRQFPHRFQPHIQIQPRHHPLIQFHFQHRNQPLVQFNHEPQQQQQQQQQQGHMDEYGVGQEFKRDNIVGYLNGWQQELRMRQNLPAIENMISPLNYRRFNNNNNKINEETMIKTTTEEQKADEEEETTTEAEDILKIIQKELLGGRDDEDEDEDKDEEDPLDFIQKFLEEDNLNELENEKDAATANADKSRIFKSKETEKEDDDDEESNSTSTTKDDDEDDEKSTTQEDTSKQGERKSSDKDNEMDDIFKNFDLKPILNKLSKPFMNDHDYVEDSEDKEEIEMKEPKKMAIKSKWSPLSDNNEIVKKTKIDIKYELPDVYENLLNKFTKISLLLASITLSILILVTLARIVIVRKKSPRNIDNLEIIEKI
jgi:hypothetical protein